MIARPFTGSRAHFKRTANRHDFAVPPPAGMLLDQLAEPEGSGLCHRQDFDIFLGRGITHSVKTKDNDRRYGQDHERHAGSKRDGLIFVNLVDFDQQYGHRNDVEGYARGTGSGDRWLPTICRCRKTIC